VIGLTLASASSAIIVYALDLVPGRVGTVAGMFFGLSFGLGGVGAAVLGVGATELVVLDAVGVGWELFLKNTVHTARPATTITTAASAAMVKFLRRRAWFARFSSCRSNLRFAVARRCLLVGTPSSSYVVCSSPEGSSSCVGVLATECAMQRWAAHPAVGN